MSLNYCGNQITYKDKIVFIGRQKTRNAFVKLRYLSPPASTEVKGKVLHTSLAAHTAGAYPGLRSMKRLGVLLLPLDGMLAYRRLPGQVSLTVCWYPFKLLGGERHCESKVSCTGTELNG